jgi:hypothetical protein
MEQTAGRRTPVVHDDYGGRSSASHFGFGRWAQYSAPVAVDQELLQRVEEREKHLQEMTAEECAAAASMLREVKPQLGTDRQRELAEAMAAEFEARAATGARAAR